jgi:thiol-disulfide isomerase/thioredoxin
VAASLAVALLSLIGAAAHGTPSDPQDVFADLRMTRMAPTPHSAAMLPMQSLDGGAVRLQDFAGKVVVLNFWATWCGPCKEEMPSLARLQEQFDLEQVRVVTITADVHPQGIKQFLSQLQIGLPVLFDQDQELSRLFMVRGLPTTVVLSPDGRQVGRAVGPRAWDSMAAVTLVRQVLRGHP